MAKKKSARKSKSFSEAVGFNYIINDKSNFIYGIIAIAFSIFLIIAFCSYFSTGQADQSLVEAPRPGELENTQRIFQNSCGSIGAYISHFLIARCFGISAFLIPFFLILCGLRMMNIYRVNLIKWFFGTSIVMIWSSVTMAKFLTPLVGDQVYNPGGDHGAFICQWLENVIGAPGLLAILLIVALAFLTYLTSETITIIRKILNPVGYLTNKVKFTITNNEKPHEDGNSEGTYQPLDEPIAQPEVIYQAESYKDSKIMVDQPQTEQIKEDSGDDHFKIDVAQDEEK